MNINRRDFTKYLSGAVVGSNLASNFNVKGAPGAGIAPGGVTTSAAFFKNPLFEYTFLISLGRSYHQAGNVGKVLYVAAQIEDGDFESGYQAFRQAADEARAQAEDSASRGHRVSAREAYLWAQNYYDCSTYFVDGSKDPTRFLPTWELLYDCWLKSTALFDPPIEAVNIPYAKTELRGFFFRSDREKEKRPLLILNNGSDGSLLDMWTQGAAGALARGYNCLTFDGPGQGYALWKQGLFFRPDWENVITPVVDYALTRPDVDPERIAISGISQGGYWVPRAVAFEHRIAAAIADPGVVDVATSWIEHLPESLKQMLKAGHKAQFDEIMTKAVDSAKGVTLRFRMRPYGFTSPFDVYKAVQDYQLREVASKIRCPMLIIAPVNEEFFPGQSQELFNLLASPKELVAFTVSDGADLHCEPKGLGLRDFRVFNWLDETLSR
jgi:Prolyl oligopeptidase family